MHCIMDAFGFHIAFGEANSREEYSSSTWHRSVQMTLAIFEYECSFLAQECPHLLSQAFFHLSSFARVLVLNAYSTPPPTITMLVAPLSKVMHFSSRSAEQYNKLLATWTVATLNELMNAMSTLPLLPTSTAYLRAIQSPSIFSSRQCCNQVRG